MEREKALTEVNLKNSWTFFPVKELACAIYNFCKNYILLK